MNASENSPPASVEWTSWLEIPAADSQFANKAGVYQIRAVDIASGKEITIPRLGDTDDSGTLYIGHSQKCIATRIRIFRKIHPPYVLASQKLGNHKLQVRARILPASETYLEEQAEIKRYGDQFGESPPCNRNATKKKC